MPNRFPSLKTSSFDFCNGNLVSQLVESNWSSLTFIRNFNCKEFVSLPLELVRGNNILRRLEIWNCENFEGFTSPNIDVEDDDQDNYFSDQVLPSNSLKRVTLWFRGLLNSRIDLRGFNSLLSLCIVFGESHKCFRVIESIIKKKSGIECLPILNIWRLFHFFKIRNPFQGTVTGTYFPSLIDLKLIGWSSLKCLPNQIQYITSLQRFKISRFESLVALPEWLGNLVSLTKLEIKHCENLKYLPSQEQMLRLTSLQELFISSGSALFDRCKEGGEEAYKISPEQKIKFGLVELIKIQCKAVEGKLKTMKDLIFMIASPTMQFCHKQET
ncbi:hypothetical protein MKW92_039237 [Papaver armeniacum]|nr:hypothetical protein MKW92_039237 [Papaver armeniacum]